MADYIALRDTWLSHENRMVRAGEKFSTEFPTVNGKPMALGGNLELVKPAKAGKGKPEGADGDAVDALV
jgi:hypothetical protein